VPSQRLQCDNGGGSDDDDNDELDCSNRSNSNRIDPGNFYIFFCCYC